MASSAFHVSFVQKSGAEWTRLTNELLEARVPLPASSDPAFPLPSGERRVLMAVRDSGTPVWGALAIVRDSRLIPWRSIVRLQRVSCNLPDATLDAVADSIVEAARLLRALRLHVQLHGTDSTARESFKRSLIDRGFSPVSEPRAYVDTVLIDLGPREDELFAAFHPTCRRGIRAPAKHGLACRGVTDPSLAARMNDLTRESMLRTGGSFEETDWAAVMQFIASEPGRACLLGVFRPDCEGPDALVGFVFGVRHGDTVEYDIAASARLPDLRVPLLYAPTWEVMRWGKREGAQWFDFGGITAGSKDSGDPTGGISDFKRYFSPVSIPVGEELVHTPSARLSSAEHLASSALASIKRAIKNRA